MLNSLGRLLCVLMLPVALQAQPVSHALVASPADLPAAPRAFRSTADSITVLAVMVQFQADTDQRTTGNGRFDTSHVRSGDIPVDAPPRDRSYFEHHLTFLRNYYHRASKGKVAISWRIVPEVITLPATMVRYSPPKNTPNTPVADLARDTWRAVDSLGLFADFASYDAFIVFHAGVGRDIDLVGSLGYDPAPLDIPSLYLGPGAFRDAHGTAGIPVRGGSFLIPNSIIIPETESRTIPGIGGDVFLEYSINGLLCASFGNFLGLPDLFDTKTGRTAIGRFGLMDGQGIFSFNGVFPPEPSAWEKYWLGWIDPIVVGPGQRTLTVPAVALADTVYRVPVGAREYFLVENRNRDPHRDGQRITMVVDGATVVKEFARDTVGFNAFDISALAGSVIDVEDLDWSLPGGVDTKGEFYDGGMLVWHCDEGVIAAGLATNTVNADIGKRGLDVEEADGSQDIGQEYGFLTAGSGSEIGTALDFWYAGNASPVNKNLFTATSHPSTASNDGGRSHVTMKDFSVRGPRMTMTVIVGDGTIVPLAGSPRETRRTLPPASLTLATIGGRPAAFVASTRTGAPALRGGLPVPSEVQARVYAWGTGAQGALPGGASDGHVVSGGSAGHGFASGPSVADLNGDGIPDVVIAESATTPVVRAFTFRAAGADSTAEPLFTTPVPSAPTTPPVIGNSVIAVGGEKGRVHFLAKDGTLISSDRLLADTTAAVAGISRFPSPYSFMVTGTDGSVVLVARSFPVGPGLADHPIRLPDGIVGPAALAGTSASSLRIAVVGTRGGLVYSLSAFLETVPGFPVRVDGGLAHPPIPADIDGDGMQDIIAFAGNRIHVWNHNGITLDNFPVALPAGDTLASTPLAADVNGDGVIDIIGATQRGLVVAYDRTGRSIAGFPLIAGLGAQSLAVATAGDSILVFAASAADGSVSGWMTGRTTLPVVAARYPWPQEQRDAEHSGYDPTPISGVPLAAEFFPPSRAYNWPNPAYDGKTMIRYYVRDRATVVIRIYDVAGDLVAELQGPGSPGMDNEVAWDLAGVQSGVYFAHIEAAGSAASGSAIVKIAVVK